jgi:hypothetical protein
MNGDRDGFDHRCVFERKGIGDFVSDVLGYGDELSESALATKLLARDTKDLAILAQVDGSFSAVVAFSAGNRRVKGDAITDLEALNIASKGLDDPSGFVAHDKRGDATT